MIGECALCQEKKELRSSHIIPKFFLKEYERRIKRKYPARGKVFLRRFDNPNQREQDIEKQNLLCQDCESLFAKYEQKLQQYLYSKKQGTIINENDVVYGLLSIIWRHILSRRSDFDFLTKKEQQYLDQLTNEWREILSKERINDAQITFYRNPINTISAMKEIEFKLKKEGYKGITNVLPFCDAFAPQEEDIMQELYIMLYTMDDIFFINCFEKQKKKQFDELTSIDKGLLKWRLEYNFLERFLNAKKQLFEEQLNKICDKKREEDCYEKVVNTFQITNKVLMTFQNHYNDKSITPKDIANYMQAFSLREAYSMEHKVSLENFKKLSKFGERLLQLTINLENQQKWDKIRYKQEILNDDSYRVSSTISYNKDSCVIFYNENIEIDVPSSFFVPMHIYCGQSPIDFLLGEWMVQLRTSFKMQSCPELINDNRYIFDFFCKLIRFYVDSLIVIDQIGQINLD